MRSYHNKERGLTVATVAVTCLPCSSLSLSLSPFLYTPSIYLPLFLFTLPFLYLSLFPSRPSASHSSIVWLMKAAILLPYKIGSTRRRFWSRFLEFFQLVFTQLVFAFTYCHLLPFCRWLPTQRSQAADEGCRKSVCTVCQFFAIFF